MSQRVTVNSMTRAAEPAPSVDDARPVERMSHVQRVLAVYLWQRVYHKQPWELKPLGGSGRTTRRRVAVGCGSNMGTRGGRWGHNYIGHNYIGYPRRPVAPGIAAAFIETWPEQGDGRFVAASSSLPLHSTTDDVSAGPMLGCGDGVVDNCRGIGDTDDTAYGNGGAVSCGKTEGRIVGGAVCNAVGGTVTGADPADSTSNVTAAVMAVHVSSPLDSTSDTSGAKPNVPTRKKIHEEKFDRSMEHKLD